MRFFITGILGQLGVVTGLSSTAERHIAGEGETTSTLAIEAARVALADVGMDASASDAGVAALCARSSVMGAFLNVRINAKNLINKNLVADFEKRGLKMVEQAQAMETEILALIERKVS